LVAAGTGVVVEDISKWVASGAVNRLLPVNGRTFSIRLRCLTGMANNPDKPRSFRQSIRHLDPYYCLLLLALPAAIVEPVKIAGLVVVGSGHWLRGLVILAFAYVLSLSFLTKLFRIVQPRLLILPWFREGRIRLLRLRHKISDRVTQKYRTWRGYPRHTETNVAIVAPIRRILLPARERGSNNIP
jgi:hypothetical protein